MSLIALLKVCSCQADQITAQKKSLEDANAQIEYLKHEMIEASRRIDEASRRIDNATTMIIEGERKAYEQHEKRHEQIIDIEQNGAAESIEWLHNPVPDDICRMFND